MFDIAWSELALIGAVALIVIGPKDLPKVMRVMGQWTRKARLLANEFQHNFDELVRQAELDDVRRQVQSVNPASLKAKVETMIDAKGIEDALRVDPAAQGEKPAAVEPAAAGTQAAEAPSAPQTALPSAPETALPAAGEPVPVPVPAGDPQHSLQATGKPTESQP